MVARASNSILDMLSGGTRDYLENQRGYHQGVGSGIEIHEIRSLTAALTVDGHELTVTSDDDSDIRLACACGAWEYDQVAGSANLMELLIRALGHLEQVRHA